MPHVRFVARAQVDARGVLVALAAVVVLYLQVLLLLHTCITTTMQVSSTHPPGASP